MPGKRRAEPLATVPKKQKVNQNKELCNILIELGDIEKKKGERFKWRAYRHAADRLANLDHHISSGAEAQGLEGVGKSIADKIDEILKTGKSHKLEEEKKDPEVAATDLFNRVYGIGPSFAKQLVHHYKCRTLDDIKAKKLPLKKQQQLGLKYFEDMSQMIPSSEVKAIGDFVSKALKKMAANATLTIAGGYRRGLTQVKDVSILVCDPSISGHSSEKRTILPKLVDELRKNGFLVDDLAEGSTKYMGFCRLPQKGALARRIDLRFVPSESYWTEVLNMTGSDTFNMSMRSNALKNGFSLSEYGIWKADKNMRRRGKQIPVESEKAIFDIIGMPYVPPEERSI